MSLDYKTHIYNLMQFVPSIWAVAIVEGENNIVYSTDNWDISADVENVCSSWNSMRAPFIIVSGVKYMLLECEIDSLVATSIKKEGHIVGVKNEERKIITYVEPDGDRKAAIVELSRVLQAMCPKTLYMDANNKSDRADLAMETRETGYVDPQLKSKIEEFLNWIKNPDGLAGYINYYLQQNDVQTIFELAKIYAELRQIFGV